MSKFTRYKLSQFLACVYVHNSIQTIRKVNQPKKTTINHLQFIKNHLNNKLGDCDTFMNIKLTNPTLTPSKLRNIGDDLWFIYKNICNNVFVILLFDTKIKVTVVTFLFYTAKIERIIANFG